MSAPPQFRSLWGLALPQYRAVEDTGSIAQAYRLIRPPSGGSSRRFTSPARGRAKWPIRADSESQEDREEPQLTSSRRAAAEFCSAAARQTCPNGEEVVRCFADGGGANAVRGADFRMQDSATRVLVNGAPASYAAAEGQELVVSPASGLVQGKTFTVTVDYAGVPNVVTDPDTSIEGWVLTDDGAVVVNEPRDADWFEQPYNAPAKEAAFGVRPSRTSAIPRCCSTAPCTTAAG
jgi:hypothetical protein